MIICLYFILFFASLSFAVEEWNKGGGESWGVANDDEMRDARPLTSASPSLTDTMSTKAKLDGQSL